MQGATPPHEAFPSDLLQGALCFYNFTRGAVRPHVSGLSGRRVDSSRIFSWGNVSGCAERGQTNPSPKFASICWRVPSVATCRRNDALPQIECMGQGIWVWVLLIFPQPARCSSGGSFLSSFEKNRRALPAPPFPRSE